MKTVNFVLSVIYALFAAIGLGLIVMGKVSPWAALVALAYASVAAALRQKGGLPLKVLAYLISVLFMLFGVGAIWMFISTFFGHAYDSVSPVVLTLFGLLGLATLLNLRKLP